MNEIAILLNNALFILLLWTCLVSIIVVHEMGHLLMFKMFYREDYKGWHIEIGKGRPIMEFNRLTLRLIPISGCFRFKTKIKVSKFQYIMMLIGGPLASLIFIFLLGFLFRYMAITNNLVFKEHNLTRFLVFIFWGFIGQFIVTLFPMSFGGYTSDGMQIIKTAIGVEKS